MSKLIQDTPRKLGPALLHWLVVLKWLTVAILGTCGSAALADYASGEAAYRSGDYQQAYEIWLPAANEGDPASQTGVGFLFFLGQGVPKDGIEAAKWYQLAAEQGHAEAQTYLGMLYDQGEGVAEDKDEAIRWYQLAVEQDNLLAQALLAVLYQAQRRFGDAELLFKQTLNVLKGNLGTDHADVAIILGKLAGLYQEQGRYEDAEPLYKQSLGIREKTLGPSSLEYNSELNNLGFLYEAQGRYKGAALLLKRSLGIWEKALGPDHPNVALAVNNMASLYETQGRYEDAEPLYKRSLVISEKAFGPDHPDVALALNNLGLLYQAQGRYKAVEPLFKRALAIWEKALGPDHPSVATGLNNLGLLYHAQGRYEDTEPLFKQAIIINEKTLGPDHIEVAKGLNNLGLLYQAQGRYAATEPLFKRSLGVTEKALGPDHPDVAFNLNNLAGLYQAQGRYGDAEPLFKRAIIIKENAFSPDHPKVGLGLNNLAFLYQTQGRYEDAEQLFKRTLGVWEKALGLDHPNVATALNNLALIYQRQGRYEDAEPLYKRSLSIREKIFGPDHPEIAISLNNLGFLYQNQKRYEDAEPLFKRSLVISEKALGPDHPDVALSLNNLGLLYQAQGRYADTELLFKRSLGIWEKALGLNHPGVVLNLAGLAVLYLKLNNKKKSLDYTRQAVAITRARAILFGGMGSGRLREQKLNRNVFVFHVKLLQETHDPSNREALISEAFESSQLAITTEAGAAIENMANRFAAKNDKIAVLVRQRQDAAEKWQRLDDAIVKSLSQPPDERDKLAEAILAKSMKKNKELLKELDDKLETSFPKFAELSGVKPATLTDTQALLAPSEALFTFISSDEATYAFLVRKDGAQAYEVDLSEEQLANIVTALRDDIDLSGAKNIADIPKFDLDLAHELYANLLGPAEDMLEGVEHLLVVPTGSMESLPLNVLVTEPPAAGGSGFDRYQSAAWLPKRFSLTRLPSVSSLRALRMFAADTRATDSFKGFGDPVLNGQPGEVRGLKLVDIYQGAQADTDKVRGLPELPETSDELRLIAKYLNSTEDDLYLRERATETELKSADLSNSRVLAFATHGLVGGELSGLAEPALVLTPPAKGSDLDDGLLKASEVAQLNLNADMVLLSACNTASGEKLGAEGLSGLARAFIYAGARSLLVSHWSVNSDAAAKLTTGLFEVLETNPEMGRAEALQNSMMSLASDDASPHYSHPAFWAPFSLIGEGAALR